MLFDVRCNSVSECITHKTVSFLHPHQPKNIILFICQLILWDANPNHPIANDNLNCFYTNEV